MTHEERIALCKICSNRSFDSKLGIACSLTGRRPDFIGTTKDFMRDEHEIEKELKREEEGCRRRKNINKYQNGNWCGVGLSGNRSVLYYQWRLAFLWRYYRWIVLDCIRTKWRQAKNQRRLMHDQIQRTHRHHDFVQAMCPKQLFLSITGH